MTKEECGKFLNELIHLYPSSLRQGVDHKTLFELWYEVLCDYDYKKIHSSLIRYFQEDQRGYAPTAGQLTADDDDNFDDLPIY